MPISGKVKNPFGAADVKALTATGVQAIAIDNNFTILDGVTVEATGNRTINLTIDTDVVGIGAKIVHHSQSNGTETSVFGTGITGATITGAAAKINTKTFTYNGTAFIADNERVN